MQNALHKKRDLALFFILILIALTGQYNHEIWRDEGKFIQISSELNLYDTIRYSRFEGLIPFYTIILEILYYIFKDKIFVLKFFNFFFFFITAMLLFKKKGLPSYLSFLVLCSYPVLSNYLLVSRIYIMLVPSIFYLIIYEDKPSKLIFLNMINLALTGVFGLIFNFCYFVSNFNYFIKYIKKRDFFLILLVLISLISFYYIIPFEGREWNQLQVPQSIYFLGVLFYKIMYSTIFLHDITASKEIWDVMPLNFFINNSLILLSVKLFLLTIASLFLSKKYNLLFLLLLSFMIFFLFFAVTSHHSFKHYFLLFIIFSAVNIKIYFLEKIHKIKNQNKIFKFVSYLTFSYIAILLIMALISWQKNTAPVIYNLNIILTSVSFLLVGYNLYFKRLLKIFYFFVFIFLIGFSYFSLNNFYTYKYLFFINLMLFIINFYIFSLSHRKYNYPLINLNILGKSIFVLCLSISCIGSFIFIAKEYKLNFSNSENVAKFIIKKKIDCNEVSAYPESTISAWSAYLNQSCKPFQIRRKIYSGFTNADLIKKNELDDSFQFKKLSKDDIFFKKYLVITCIDDCYEETIFFKKFIRQNGGIIKLFNEPTLAKIREQFIIYVNP